MGTGDAVLALGLKLLVWASAAAVVSVYLLYPASLALLSRFRRRRPIPPEGPLPRVTLIVSAFNERGVIRQKLENALALSYPRERLEILVISDGSDDGTDDIVREFEARGVRLCRQEPRAGKTLGLTRFVPQARGEVLLFSDANSVYDALAVRKLVRHFADPGVGYVVGHQRYLDAAGSAVSRAEQLYWAYEVFLKKCESRLGSVVGGDGAIYAIRAELFSPLEADDINDFVNPLQIVARGYRGVFDEEAFCHEHTASSFQGEFRRKTRIVNRSLRGLLRVPAVLNPLRVGWFAYQITFHKLLRWFVPYFLISLFLGTAALAGRGEGSMYAALLGAQLVFYGAAAGRAWTPWGRSKVFYIPYYFCLVNLAAFRGTLSVLGGHRYVTWTPDRAAL